MSKPMKNLEIQDLSKRYAGVDSACVVDLTGLDAIATHKLRGGLRSKGIELHVVKNRLAKRAFADSPLAAIGTYLDGPCALATGGSSIVDVAKELVRWHKDLPAITLKKAVVEGDADLVDVEVLAKWRSRAEVQGEAAMLAVSPGRRLVGCVAGPGGRIAGCLKAIIEKLEKTQGPAPEPAAA